MVLKFVFYTMGALLLVESLYFCMCSESAKKMFVKMSKGNHLKKFAFIETIVAVAFILIGYLVKI